MMWHLQGLVSFTPQLHSATLSSFVIAGIICLCIWIFAPLSRPIERNQDDPVSLNLSLWEQAYQWHKDAVGLIQRAHTTFPGRVFQVYSRAGPQVFIPPNMMDEIKALPDNVLSISDWIRESMETEHTLFPDPGHQEWILWIKQNLCRNIAKYAGIVIEVLPLYLSMFFQDKYDGKFCIPLT
ncbi:hypothetical protein N431DRAFT_459803 [Stipitochalara longipes BDJ]|nr:hypothetical protein N431DRAFT_459803 [Stipitochalara longipes BDJ]